MELPEAKSYQMGVRDLMGINSGVLGMKKVENQRVRTSSLGNHETIWWLFTRWFALPPVRKRSRSTPSISLTLGHAQQNKWALHHQTQKPLGRGKDSGWFHRLCFITSDPSEDVLTCFVRQCRSFDKLLTLALFWRSFTNLLPTFKVTSSCCLGSLRAICSLNVVKSPSLLAFCMLGRGVTLNKKRKAYFPKCDFFIFLI